MQEVIGVKFNSNPKVYFFSPKGITFSVGDGVIVETSRGMEYGVVASSNYNVCDDEIISPLKPVVRKATPKDLKQYEENLEKKVWANKVCLEKIQAHGLEMKLVNTEYTFDRSKVIFTFTAEGRVDFRELVKDLASVLKTRIELRQIYERDDIKMRGALAPCGRICCCHNHLKDFEKVSIKMAKNQNLSLNPQKISGVCGKLMCCLKYENDYYVEANKIMPKLNSIVQTNYGDTRVEYTDLLKQTFKGKVKLDDDTFAIKDFKLDDIISSYHTASEDQTDSDDDDKDFIEE